MTVIDGTPRIQKIVLSELEFSNSLNANLNAHFDLLDKNNWKCASTIYNGIWSENTRNRLIELINCMERDVAQFLFNSDSRVEDENSELFDSPTIEQRPKSDIAEEF